VPARLIIKWQQARDQASEKAAGKKAIAKAFEEFGKHNVSI